MNPRHVEPTRHWVQPAALLVVVGTCCVVLGGLVAALTEPMTLTDGSWLAAYLVLVSGVPQCALGLIPSRLAALPTSSRLHWTQLVCWNIGTAGVIAGTLTDHPMAVDAGAALLAVGLGTAWYAIRHTVPPGGAARIVGWAYRFLLLLLLISIPIGSILAHLRALV